MSSTLSDLMSKTTPVVRLKKSSIELVMDNKLKRPILKIGGKKAEKVYAILTEKFLTRKENDYSEVLIPLRALPAVGVWLLASYTNNPSEELLDMLLSRTPKVIADFFWDLIELSQSFYKNNKRKDRPFIEYRIALKASKVVRALLEIYKLKW